VDRSIARGFISSKDAGDLSRVQTTTNEKEIDLVCECACIPCMQKRQVGDSAAGDAQRTNTDIRFPFLVGMMLVINEHVPRLL